MPERLDFSLEPSPVRGISRTVFVVSVVSFLTDLSSEMIYPLLPAFIQLLGGGALDIGLIEGLAETTASLGKLGSGWLTDAVGRRKPLVVVGYTISSITRPLVALAAAPWNVVLIRFVDRIGKGIRTSPRDLLIVDSTPPESRGRAFGFHRAMDHGGATVGTLVAFALMQWMGFGLRSVFWLAAAPALLTVITLVVGVKEIRPEARPATLPRLTLKPFGPAFKGYLGILLIFTLANSSDMFLLWMAGVRGIPVKFAPLLWALLHLVKSLSSTPGGAISDRMGRRVFIVGGWIVYALVYLGFGLSRHPYQIWILFAAYGVFAGLTEGAEKALVSELTSPEVGGVAFGLYNFVVGIGLLPASLIMGWLLQSHGPAAGFGFDAALAAMAALLLHVWLAKHHPAPRTS